MKFEDFESGIRLENKKLKMILSVTLLLSISVLGLILVDKRHLVFQGGEVFKERPLAVDVCREGFLSIVSGKPNKQFVANEILEILDKEPFEIDSPEILRLKSLEEKKCQLVVKSEKRLRSFVVGLESEEKNPFFYKLNELTEVEAQEGEE